MKQIAKNTVLKQGDKTFQPVESDGIIYWVDKPLDSDTPGSIVALTKPKFTGVPIISLDDFVEQVASECFEEFRKPNILIPVNHRNPFKLGFIKSHYRSPNQFTLSDIEKTMDLMYRAGLNGDSYIKSWDETMEEICSISCIEVDDEFNIISYE